MDTQKNNISSQTILSSIAGMMFFAPLVKQNVKRDPIYTEEERTFITGYLQVGFVNLVFLLITSIATIITFFINSPILTRVINIGGFAIYIISMFSILACINRLSMRKSDESIMQNIQHKDQLAKAYIPGLNFSSRFRQENYTMPYWRLKESILLWTFFIFGTLLLGSSFGVGVLIIIAIRFILLLMNIDIIPLSMKKAINGIFSCNPGEIMAYISAPVISKLRKIEYETILQKEKDKYAQGQNFGVAIVIQYILFLGLLYLIHMYMNISVGEIVLAIAAILWILRVIMFYSYKKMCLRIPVLSELVSLIFH